MNSKNMIAINAKSAEDLRAVLLKQLDNMILHQQRAYKEIRSRRQSDVARGSLHMLYALRETWENIEIIPIKPAADAIKRDKPPSIVDLSDS